MSPRSVHKKETSIINENKTIMAERTQLTLTVVEKRARQRRLLLRYNVCNQWHYPASHLTSLSAYQEEMRTATVEYRLLM